MYSARCQHSCKLSVVKQSLLERKFNEILIFKIDSLRNRKSTELKFSFRRDRQKMGDDLDENNSHI